MHLVCVCVSPIIVILINMEVYTEYGRLGGKSQGSPLRRSPNAIPDAKEWNVFLTPPPLSNWWTHTSIESTFQSVAHFLKAKVTHDYVIIRC